MADDTRSEKSIDDLMAEFNILVAHADDVRRQMKALTLQIEARGAKAPLFGRSSHEIDIPKEPVERL